jgi:hypothetical protein
MIRLSCCALVLILAAAPALAQKRPEAKNMALVGTNDLQARSAYQPTIHQQFGRWIAYIGHHGGTDEIAKPVNPMTGVPEYNGTSLVDVTDPRHPKYLTHIPGDEGLYESGGAQMVRVCDGKSLPKGDANSVYMLRNFGKKGQEIWDTGDPEHPKLVTRIGFPYTKDTHKNFWECDTGIAYIVNTTEEPGWRVPRVMEVYDLSDPAHPVKIRDFGLPGQQPGATGKTPIVLHGPISLPKQNRIYLGYGTVSDGIMQILDREKLLSGPKEPTEANLLYPQIARLDLSPLNGAHTAFPLLNIPVKEFAPYRVGKMRNFVVVPNEETANECTGNAEMVWFVDITMEKNPVVASTFQVTEETEHFCTIGGRFGSHSSNENMTPIYYGKLMFFSWFNAGLRVVDVRDPYHPREVAHYIPAVSANTDKRCIKLESGQQSCKIAIQTNNAEVDDRGYIYIVDRANTGMHILELTGAAKKIADFSVAKLAAR